MERGRLETEFRKLKESKKKAEQYAVEAKQTAQRLSAENFKLREDLSKERHFNELTRKNMMREVELSIVRKEGHTKTKAIRSEVFDEEVAKRAFLGRQSSSLYHRGAYIQKGKSPYQVYSSYAKLRHNGGCSNFLSQHCAETQCHR